METITASLVVYKNDFQMVERAVSSFLGSPLAKHLFIVDNSPTDTISRHIQRHPKITHLFAGTNLGYGRAHNRAIRQCLDSASYHLVLNPDVYFDSAIIENLHDYMQQHPDTGLVMPRVLYPDGTLQRLCKLLPTPFNLVARRFIPLKLQLLKRINDHYEMGFSNYNQVMNVPFLSGCFMFLRTDALKSTGLFDERFFLYAEDTDLSRRIHRHYKTVFYPHVHIFHHHARGSYKKLRLTWYNLISAVQYFNKWGWVADPERKLMNLSAQNQFQTRINYDSFLLNATPVPQRSPNE